MNTIKRINTIGNIIKIFGRIANVMLIVAGCLVLICAVAFTIMPNNAIRVHTNANTTVDIDEDSFGGIWSKIISIDGFEDNVEEDGVSIKFFDSGLSVDGISEDMTLTVRNIAVLFYCLALKLLMMSVIFHFISKLGKALKTGHSPFLQESVKALKQIGYTILGASIGATIISWITSCIIYEMPGLPTDFKMDFGFVSILFSLFFLALAYIFQYGVQLQNESDHTL